MTNNLDTLKELLTFEEVGDYYFIQVFQRRKDIPTLEHGVKRIKNYSIYNLDELEKTIPKLVNYQEELKARVYIRLNKQNSKTVTLNCIEQLVRNIKEGNTKNSYKVWDVMSGKGGEKKHWVLDIDEEHINYEREIATRVATLIEKHLKEVRNLNIKLKFNQTKSGVHLITIPFDVRILNDINKKLTDGGVPKIDIQKDANTLLIF